MFDDNIDQLIQRHEMGQAYKAITKAMGPSLQLLAFVNYEKVTDDNLGLESFDLMGQHNQVLADIEQNNLFEIACESLAGKVKSAASRVKIAVTLNTHAKNLDKFKGKLEPRDSNTNTVKHDEFNKAATLFDDAAKKISQILENAPKSLDLESWSSFDNDKASSGVKELLDRAENLGSPVDFKSSGWNEGNFKSGIGTYQSKQAKGESVDKAFSKYLDDLETYIAHAKRKVDLKAVRAMNRLHSDLRKAYGAMDDAAGEMWQALNDTAQHFKAAA